MLDDSGPGGARLRERYVEEGLKILRQCPRPAARRGDRTYKARKTVKQMLRIHLETLYPSFKRPFRTASNMFSTRPESFFGIPPDAKSKCNAAILPDCLLTVRRPVFRDGCVGPPPHLRRKCPKCTAPKRARGSRHGSALAQGICPR